MAPTAPLVAPILLPSGSLHFAAIKPDGTAQDVISALINLPEVREDVLGDLGAGYVDATGWALQKVLKSSSGKPWEDEELQEIDTSAHGALSCITPA